MTRKHLSLLAGCLLLGSLLTGCSGSSNSSNNNPTNPGGGGGGGAGGGAKELNSGPLVNGADYSHVFANAGDFPYICTIHGSPMTGVVHVVAGGTDSALVDVGPGGTLTFSPNSVTVKQGGTVRWINNSGINHTVTSQ